MRNTHDPRGTTGEDLPKTIYRTFYPLATVRCEGATVFRSQRARDVGCLLDVDDAVVSWTCMPPAIDGLGQRYVPDFPYYLDAPDRSELGPNRLRETQDGKARPLLALTEEELRSGFRLANAKDLLRYGSYNATLGDRLRLLAALDEHGTLTLAECLSTRKLRLAEMPEAIDAIGYWIQARSQGALTSSEFRLFGGVSEWREEVLEMVKDGDAAIFAACMQGPYRRQRLPQSAWPGAG